MSLMNKIPTECIRYTFIVTRNIDQLRTFIRMVLSRGVNFGGHLGGQNVQVSMLQNGMVASSVQSAERFEKVILAIGKKFEC